VASLQQQQLWPLVNDVTRIRLPRRPGISTDQSDFTVRPVDHSSVARRKPNQLDSYLAAARRQVCDSPGVDTYGQRYVNAREILTHGWRRAKIGGRAVRVGDAEKWRLAPQYCNQFDKQQ